MATLDELQQQLNALQQRVDAITAPPTDYYTQRYSGEETDRGVEIALGLDPEGTGIVTPEHGGTGADTTQAALAALGAGVRPNELDNPGFEINQRGQAQYTTTAYGVDRWFFNVSSGITATYDVSTKTIKTSEEGVAGKYGELRQVMSESWCEKRQGKTVTMSALYEVKSGYALLSWWSYDDPNGSIIDSGATQQITGSGLAKFIFTIPSTSRKVAIRFLAYGEVSFKYVKCEDAEDQTLAYQDSNGDWQLLPQPDSSYGTQLLECQRYQMAYQLIANGLYWPCIAQTATNAKMYVQLPIGLRALPTVTVDLSSVVLFDGSATYAITGMSVYTMSNNVLTLSLQTSGLTPGQSYQFRSNQATLLVFSSNL